MTASHSLDRRTLHHALEADVRAETALIHADHGLRQALGTPNPPVFRTSTVLFETQADFEHAHHEQDHAFVYGRVGSPTSWALEDALRAISGAELAVLAPSGLAAIHVALASVLGAGDHVLITAGVYSPTERLCRETLSRFGIRHSIVDGLSLAAIEAALQPETRAIYVESPASNTLEVPDLQAIIALARARGIAVLSDDTWATPLYARSLEFGADFSIHAATKYIVGHSDAMAGVVLAKGPHAARLLETARNFGIFLAPDDAYLALRGLRTLPVRLRQQGDSALALAAWLAQQAQVHAVLHPALPGNPHHANWQRNFRGSSGLFSFVLRADKEQASAFASALRYFAVGASWGGYESLVRVYPPASAPVPEDGPASLVRLSIGLENTDDLLADLQQAFTHTFG
jgi:cysteine-S-conjugate beta-lyase